MSRTALTRLALLTLAALPLAAAPPAQAAPERTRLFAFYTEVDRGAHARMQRVLPRLDVLAPNWFSVRPDRPSRLRGGFDREVLRMARAAGTEVWPVVNGQLRDRPDAFASAATRRAFCTRAAALVRPPATRGLTLDLEGVDAAHADDLTALVRRCAAAVHARGGRLAVYAPRRVARFTTTWNAAYDVVALAAAADLVLASTYTESWERPGPMTTPRGLREALAWGARAPRAHVAPIVGTFGLRWAADGADPELVAQRDAEREAAHTAGVLRDVTGGAFSTPAGEVRFTDAPAAARGLREIRRQRFRWAAVFSVGRESASLWQLIPRTIGRPATPR